MASSGGTGGGPRYQDRKIPLYFRADAAFAQPELYEYLETEGFEYAIRLPGNDALLRDIEPMLTRPVGRPSNAPVVWYAGFLYQAKSWNRARRVVAKVEWHHGELFPRVGFIVTNLIRPPKRVVRFYDQRGTAEQWIKEGKNAVKWTRLSCHDFVDNQVRLHLFVLAYNLGNFLRQTVLPQAVRHWSLTTLREKLIKIGAKVVRHSRKIVFQMAEVAVPRELFQTNLERIGRLRVSGSLIRMKEKVKANDMKTTASMEEVSSPPGEHMGGGAFHKSIQNTSHAAENRHGGLGKATCKSMKKDKNDQNHEKRPHARQWARNHMGNPHSSTFFLKQMKDTSRSKRNPKAP